MQKDVCMLSFFVKYPALCKIGAFYKYIMRDLFLFDNPFYLHLARIIESCIFLKLTLYEVGARF